jgi:glycosyltransferase involved in cell wall biosynthesis
VTRVLHLSRYAHPFVGGTENFVGGLVRHTAHLGVESAILCSTRRSGDEGPHPEAPVVRVGTFGPDRFQVVRHANRDVRALVRWADVLHFHDLRFGFDLVARIAEVRRTPRIMSTHGLVFHTDEHALIKRLAWRTVIEPALRRFDTVVADSAADFAHVRDLRHARLIPNPVEVDPFLAMAGAPVNLTGPLLYFGRLAANKGIDRLAPTLARTRERLEVVGTGDQAEVARLSAAFGDTPVDFAGSVSGAALLQALRRCSAVVLPSRTEGFGLTLVEAMASGRPVVAADIEPFREIARDTDVRLVDFDHPADVLSALSAARADAERARSVERARTYSWEARAPEFVELYRRLATGAAPSTDA